MNHSPLIVSYSLIASLSLFYIGASWSDAQAQQNSAEKSKVLKAKTAKAKPYRTRSHQPLATKAAVIMPASSQAAATAIAEPLKLTVAESLNSLPAAPEKVTINPYFLNQPAAILPKSVQPLLPVQAAIAQPAVAPVQIAITPPVIPAPAAAAPVVSSPVVSSPVVAAPVFASPVVKAPIHTPPVAVAPPSAFAPPLNAYQPSNTYQPTNVSRNPYLAYQYQAAPAPQVMPTMDLTPRIYPPVAVAPVAVPPVAYTPTSFAPQNQLTKWAGNIPTGWLPSLPFQTPTAAPTSFQTATPTSPPVANNSSSGTSILSNLKMMIPLTGDADILPSIKKVYPTGEKPLVVINFKCPTELVGITPPPMKLLHEALNFGFDGLNKTNLLSFNLQQVCS
jgi:hypothetical protein